jgi:hypothetical protein
MQNMVSSVLRGNVQVDDVLIVAHIVLITANVGEMALRGENVALGWSVRLHPQGIPIQWHTPAAFM